MLQKKAISADALGLLKQLMADPALSGFVLVGGTSLALQYGHRLSEDLDLFCSKNFILEKLQQHISNIFPHAVLLSENEIGLQYNINKIKVDFLYRISRLSRELL